MILCKCSNEILGYCGEQNLDAYADQYKNTHGVTHSILAIQVQAFNKICHNYFCTLLDFFMQQHMAYHTYDNYITIPLLKRRALKKIMLERNTSALGEWAKLTTTVHASMINARLNLLLLMRIWLKTNKQNKNEYFRLYIF